MSLKDIKAGDEVIRDSSGFHSSLSLVTVDRTTKTQIVIGNERYNRDNGYLRGGSAWYRAHIEEPTPETRGQARISEKRKKARTAALLLADAKMSEPVLDAIIEAYKLHRKDGTPKKTQ